MSAIRYTVDFYGSAPEQLEVGDWLDIAGSVQVRAIHGDIVDVTAWGRDPEFAIGAISVDLIASRLDVQARPEGRASSSPRSFGRTE